ncbi:DUF2304 domain-containing protein [Carnobacterium mobile]|uniref:DUF2304 domain-containing protein n=1 Tax=Carnobacterium mobile TaxID=2750 RepID=UPI001866EE31|nr:DUF2304 domain-containing protein [Carnobacterium mobile]
MTIGLRIILLLGATFTTYYFAKQVNKGRVEIQYSLFWILLSIFFVIIGIFPVIIIFLANLIGIQSPANLLFLIIIFILLLKEFNSTIKLSKLEEKLTSLIQKIAIDETDTQK